MRKIYMMYLPFCVFSRWESIGLFWDRLRTSALSEFERLRRMSLVSVTRATERERVSKKRPYGAPAETRNTITVHSFYIDAELQV